MCNWDHVNCLYLNANVPEHLNYLYNDLDNYSAKSYYDVSLTVYFSFPSPELVCPWQFFPFPCVGSFTSPDIDTRQKGPTSFSGSSKRHRQCGVNDTDNVG